jgi:ribose transport system permease protein
VSALPHLLDRHKSLFVLYGLLVALVVVIGILRPETFRITWLSNILLFAAPLGLMAAGQTLVMLTKGIDLSVTAVATATAYVMATNAHLGDAGAMTLGLSVALAIGALNGIGIAVFRVMPLIMTLATGLVTIGGLTVYSQRAMGQPSRVPDILQLVGSGKIGDVLPYNLLVWAVLAALVLILLARTGFGRLLYAIGDNEEACRLSGVHVWKVLVANYAACAFLSGCAGLLLVGSTNAADLGLANPYLLPSVAAVVVGGTSIFGGRGGYGGTIAGALILTVLNSVLTLMNASEPVKQILYGSVILALAALYTRIAVR